MSQHATAEIVGDSEHEPPEIATPGTAPPGTFTPGTASTRTRNTVGERQLGRGHRYSSTGVQNMETQILKCLENMRDDKKEGMKRKHELQEKLLALEEKKLAIKQQKVEALKSISDNIKGFLNGSH